MAVKEKDLPQVGSLSGSDYVRAVSSGGASEIVPFSALGIVTPTDYVTSQGSSGDWHYRKWNSGKEEAWATINEGSQSSTTWVSPLRYRDSGLNVPSGIFSATPDVVIANSAGNQWEIYGAWANSSTSLSYRAVTLASTSQTLKINFYVIKL